MTPGAMTPGFTTPSGDLDLIKIGEARKSLVGVKLDQVCSEYEEQCIGQSILMAQCIGQSILMAQCTGQSILMAQCIGQSILMAQCIG